MTVYIQSALEIVGAILGIAISIGIIAYAVGQFKGGKDNGKTSEDSAALISSQLKDNAITDLTKEVARLNAVVIQYGKDIASLQAQLTSEKEKNLSLINLLANRDPAFNKFMVDSVEAHKQILEGINKLLSQ